jgi:5'-deoxynucleotidase YfbR-like HD superfamily hydrolase
MEFEEGQTLEAVLMVQLDKLDAAIQALEYEKQ